MPSKTVSERREAVMAWLCGLTSKLDNDQPSLEQAQMYARTNYTKVTPDSAMETLGVDSWEQVLKYYNKTHLGYEAYCKRYSKEQVVSIARTLWQETGGRITQRTLINRAKRTPTPSWDTFKKYLGPRETWEAQLFPEATTLTSSESAIPELPPQPEMQPTSASLPELPRPEPQPTSALLSEPPQTPPEPKSASELPPIVAQNKIVEVEIKIPIPGLESPIVIQITTKSPT